MFHRSESEETSAIGHHAFLPPICTAEGSRLFLGFHLFGTSDRVEMSELMQTRLFCHAVVHWLPDRALPELTETLSDLCKFYLAPAKTRTALPAPPPMSVRVGPAVTRPVFPVGEE